MKDVNELVERQRAELERLNERFNRLAVAYTKLEAELASTRSALEAELDRDWDEMWEAD